MVYKSILLIAALSVQFGLSAQETISPGGGNASGSNGSSSYTIGQIFYSTSTSTSGSVAQGVQQPFEISVVTSVNETTNVSLVCEVYPNPTPSDLKLEINEASIDNVYYQLYDLNGKLLSELKVETPLTIIKMAGFNAGTYILKIMQGNNVIKVFKIIKN